MNPTDITPDTDLIDSSEAEHYHELGIAERPTLEARFNRTRTNAWLDQQDRKQAAEECITVEELRARRLEKWAAEWESQAKVWAEEDARGLREYLAQRKAERSEP